MDNVTIKKIDEFSIEPSVLLHFDQASGALNKQELSAASIREGLRIVPLTVHKGVPVYLLDETTEMACHTFEALVAAVSIAHCLKSGLKKVYFSSGGNLGEALTYYARKAGIKTFSFNPLINVPLLDASLFNADHGHWLIGTQDAQKNRDLALEFGRRLKKRSGENPLIPKSSWRNEALSYRGLGIVECMESMGIEFGAFSQTISAGFGPMAIFDVLTAAEERGDIPRLPRFLGVQQEANSYMYQRWKKNRFECDEPLIVPTLFDHNPDRTFGTFPAIEALLRRSEGDMVAVNQAEMARLITPDLLGKIRARGIHHTVQDGEILARSGLMALAGTLKAIESGVLQDGPVLVGMTDGVRASTKSATSSAIVSEEDDLDSLVERFIDLD